MTHTILTALYKELHLPNELKGTLSECLGVEIPVEVKEENTNEITIQIENAFSGFIYLQEQFNKNNTIKEMKEQVKKSLQNKKETVLFDFHFYNEKREEITNDERNTIDKLFQEDDYLVLAVSFKTGNMLITLLEKYPYKPWNWDYISDNPNITMDIIEKYSNKSWDWHSMSWNPNITMEFIEKNKDKIYFQALSGNTFNYNEIKIKKK